MKKLSLKLSVLLGITVVALIALGVSGWFYSAHALPRTSLAGQSISSLSQQQVEDQLRQRVDSAKVTLTVAEQTREASLSDLGISVDVPATVDAAFSENRSLFSRFRGLFRSRSITPVVNFDQSKLAAFGTALTSQVGTPMSDAHLKVSDDGTTFEVVPAQEGITIESSELTKVQQEVATDLGTQGRSIPVEVRKPQVTTERAEEAKTQAMALIAPSVTITDGIDDFTASQQDKMKWVKVSVEGDKAAVLDSQALSAWVNELAKSTNVESEKGIQGVNSRGDVVGVLKAGTVGYRANNTESVIYGNEDSLKKGKSYSGDF